MPLQMQPAPDETTSTSDQNKTLLESPATVSLTEEKRLTLTTDPNELIRIKRYWFHRL